MLPSLITTERLVLRLPCPADGPRLQELWDDEEALEHVGTVTAWSRDAAVRRIESWRATHRRGGWSPYTVTGRNDGAVMGLCGLIPDEARAPELGCMLIRRYWQRGFCREALTAVLDRCRARLDLSQLVVRIEVGNPALPYLEKRVLNPNGFTADREASVPQSGRVMRYYRAERRSSVPQLPGVLPRPTR